MIPALRNRSPAAFGAAVAAIGLAGLVGWAAKQPWLTQWRGDSIPIAPNTAAAFALLGASLAAPGASRGARRAAGLAAAGVALFAALRLLEYLSGRDFGVDGWLLRVPAGTYGLAPVGKMAFFTAVTLLLASASACLLAADARGRARDAAGALGLAAAGSGAVFVLGYLVGAPLLASAAAPALAFGQPAIPMAFGTATAFVLLGAGLAAAAGPEAFPLRPLAGTSIGARLLRVFLPFAVAGVFLAAWLASWSAAVPHSHRAVATAALTVAAALAAAGICTRIAGKVGAELALAEAELRQARDGLEQRVEERTGQLRALAANLAEVNEAERRTVQSLQQSEERFELAVRGSAAGLWDWDVATGYVYFAPRFKELLGYADHEMENRFEAWSVLLHSEDREGVLAALRDHVERGVPYDVEYRLRHARGEWRWFRARGQAIWGVDARAQRMAGSIQDVTDRKQAERRLAMQYAVVRTLAESESLAAAMPQILQTVCQSLGWELGAYWRPDADLPRLRCLELWRAPESDFADFEAATRASLFSPGVGLPGRVWSAREPAWIPDVTIDGNFPRAAVAARCGVHGGFAFPLEWNGEIIGVIEFFSSEVRQPDRDLLPVLGVLGSQIGQFLAHRRAEQELRQSAGELARSNADLANAVAAAVQVNQELRRTQAQLVQSEKLASLGQLVAGVAHEINNPLAFVTNNVAVLEGYSQDLTAVLACYRPADAALAERRPDLAAALAETAERVELDYVLANAADVFARTRDGLKRILQIVKDLREFARLDRSARETANLNDGIASTVNIVRSRARSRQVEIALDLAPLPAVPCYPAKIHQVVMNLVTNAIDACAERGQVAVRTRAVPGGVAIVVEDNGSGIDPAHLDKLYDPFFTTKPVGQGTGLGLSISYGIVRDHAGRLDVVSELGKGTTFTVFLPSAPAVSGLTTGATETS